MDKGKITFKNGVVRVQNELFMSKQFEIEEYDAETWINSLRLPKAVLTVGNAVLEVRYERNIILTAYDMRKPGNAIVAEVDDLTLEHVIVAMERYYGGH